MGRSSSSLMFALEAVDVSYREGTSRRTILRNVNLSIGREIVSIIGPNGSGKSTLVAALAGIVKPDQGRIHSGDRRSEPLGVLWQDYRESNFPWLDALDNIAIGAVFGGIKWSVARGLASNALSSLLPEVSPTSAV